MQKNWRVTGHETPVAQSRCPALLELDNWKTKRKDSIRKKEENNAKDILRKYQKTVGWR
jgi:L-lysine 2,3-aminomutase